jgi:hypothetical protein
MKSIVQTFTTQTLPSNPVHGQLVFLSDTDNILIADKTGSTLVWRQYNSEAQYISNAPTAPSYPLYLRGVNQDAFSNINNYDQYKNDDSVHIIFDKWNIEQEKTPRVNNDSDFPRNYYRSYYTISALRSQWEIQNYWDGYSQNSTDYKYLPESEAEAEAKGMTAYSPRYRHYEYPRGVDIRHKGIIFPSIINEAGGYNEYAIWETMTYLGERDTDDLQSTIGAGTVWQMWKWKNYNNLGGIDNWAMGKYPCWYLSRYEKSLYSTDPNFPRVYQLKHYFLIADPDGSYRLQGYTSGIETNSSSNMSGRSERILDIELGTNFWGVTAGKTVDSDGNKDFVFLTPEPKFSTNFTRANQESALFFDDVLPYSGDGYQLIEGKYYRETTFHISPLMLDTDSSEQNTSLTPGSPTGLSFELEYDSDFKPSNPTGLEGALRLDDNTVPGSGGDTINNLYIRPMYNLDPSDLRVVTSAHRRDIDDAIEYVSKLLNTKSEPWEIRVQIYLYGSDALREYGNNAYEDSDGPQGTLAGASLTGVGNSRNNDLFHVGFDDKKYLRVRQGIVILDPADLQNSKDDNGNTVLATFSNTQGKQFIDSTKYGTYLYFTMIHELLHMLGFSDRMFFAEKHLGLRENRDDIYPNRDLVVPTDPFKGYMYAGTNGLHEWNQLTGVNTTVGTPMGSVAILDETLGWREYDHPGHYVMDFNENDYGITGLRVHYVNGIQCLARKDPSSNNRYFLMNRYEIMNRIKYTTEDVPFNLRQPPFVSPVTAGIMNDVGWIVDRDLIHNQYNDPQYWVYNF